jgi:hypothetical protein
MVTVTMIGLPPAQPVRMGFGSLSQYEVLGRGEADPVGSFSMEIKVPAWAELDRVHYFVVSLGGQMPRILSEPFHVTDADGTARIYGTVNDEGVSCLAVDGQEDTLYTLQGNHRSTWSVGQRVMVIGTVAERSACGGQGLPIAVREIRPSL